MAHRWKVNMARASFGSLFCILSLLAQEQSPFSLLNVQLQAYFDFNSDPLFIEVVKFFSLSDLF